MSIASVHDFHCLDPLGGDRVRVRFAGTLLGKPLVWDATLLILPPGARRFIEVGGATPAGRALTVGLDVAAIDHPTVLKTVIMIRGWKNLRPGRHEHGAPAGATR